MVLSDNTVMNERLGKASERWVMETIKGTSQIGKWWCSKGDADRDCYVSGLTVRNLENLYS